MESALERPQTDAETLRLAIAKIEAVLDGGFAFHRIPLNPWISADAALTLNRVADSVRSTEPIAQEVAKFSPVAEFAVELRRRIDSGAVAGLAEQVKRLQAASRNLAPLVVAPYIPPLMQERLSKLAINFADTTGNLRIQLDDPLIVLRQVGATSDPWRGPGRPPGNMKGRAAASVARALADFEVSGVPVTALASIAHASIGPTYRVLSYLQEAGALARESRGPVRDVNWRQVLELWAKDYSFVRDNDLRRFVAARGIDVIPGRLADRLDTGYAITGSLAAQKYAPYAPARAAMIYADNIDSVAEELGLVEIDTGANVLLATPRFAVVFERTRRIDGAIYAAPSQVVVDLMQAAGRGPAEAENLFSWMELNPDAWRRPATD